MEDQNILCAASAYTEKFYINPEYSALPEGVIEELQIACVLFTADVGGVLTIAFDEEGNLELQTSHNEDDYFYDEIGSALKIKELQKDKRELFEALEMFYQIFILQGNGIDEAQKEPHKFEPRSDRGREEVDEMKEKSDVTNNGYRKYQHKNGSV